MDRLPPDYASVALPLLCTASFVSLAISLAMIWALGGWPMI